MKVINIHKRVIEQPKSELARLFNTLTTDNDMMIATDKWSPIKMDKGLQVGSKGGHGPIKYFVTEYKPENSVKFQFDLKGFNGFHQFELIECGTDKTELIHIIDMTTSGWAIIKWAWGIRWLHDAYVEDSFDKVENHFTKDKKSSEWSLWVRILRRLIKRK